MKYAQYLMSSLFFIGLLSFDFAHGAQNEASKPTQKSGPADCHNKSPRADKRGIGGTLCAPPMTVVNTGNLLPEGTVQLRVLADKNGKVIVATPILGDSKLYEKAVAAVKKMRFKPRTLSGR